MTKKKPQTPNTGRLKVVFLWHMHQPDYRDPETGQFILPWAYLHGLKDYSDMAAHLEAHPRMRAVVNFVPTLVHQILDYCAQFESGTYRDPILGFLARPDFSSLSPVERDAILDRCFRANVATMIRPFEPYHRLYEVFSRTRNEPAEAKEAFTSAMLGDAVVWYHLAWLGETERRARPIFAELVAKGGGFDHADRQRLLKQLGEVIQGIVPRYRALAERGQIEISATPFAHPLGPLLISFASTREASPDAALPEGGDYPGGAARVRVHVTEAAADHARWFGAPPAGLWPAEGAVSEEFLEALSPVPLRWAASSASVLANSLRKSGLTGAMHEDELFRGYRLPRGGPALFFRHEELSDLIGFKYRSWWGSDAAQDLIGRLEKIRERIPPGATEVVSVILDGENAWEHYPYNGFYFFRELYSRLENHPDIETTTFSAFLENHSDAIRPLERLAAGSWVHGNFLKWIGSPDKNRAWELLRDAKRVFDLYCACGAPPAVERILRSCESSDWFWWFGDQDPEGTIASFDALFRRNLRGLYRALGVEVPANLDEPVSRGGAQPSSGAMQQAS